MSFKETTSCFNRINRLQRRSFLRWFIFIVMIISGLAFYMQRVHDRAYVEMELTTNVKKGNLQLYWADEGQPFSEANSMKIPIIGGKNRVYSFYFTDLRKVRRLRIDPIEKTGKIRLHYVVLSQEEVVPITLVRGRFKSLEPVRDIINVRYDKDGMSMESTGGDPGLLWEIQPQIVSRGYLTELFRLFAFVCVCWLLARYLTMADGFFFQIKGLLWCMVLGLVITMAITSGYNKHPDEYVHATASRFYENNWLPPEICQPGTEESYSVYGLSRLNSKEIVYFLSGKITSMLSFLPLYDYLRLRLFNVLLLIIIVLSWYRHKNSAMLFMPFLITPQVWYVFSYWNSDAFAYFVSLVICQQLVFKDTFLKRCWNAEDNEPWLLFRSVICGMLLGLIFFTKSNYYIIYVFFAGYFLIEVFFAHDSVKIPWQRVGGFLLGSIFVTILFYSPHILANGPDHKQKLAQCREKMARTPYKPSTPLEEKASGIYLKRKGIPLSHLLQKMRWGERIFRSSVGVYGYSTHSGPQKYYKTMKTLMVIWGMVIVVLVIVLADNKRRVLLVWTIGCILLLFGLVLWRCWVADFQTQGRYLLPILSIIGVMMYKARSVIDKPILDLLTIVLFLASCYSFMFIGLKNIPII